MAANQPATGYDLFISYSRRNEEWVETLRQQLNGIGLTCFVDTQELSPGESFPQGLNQALERGRYRALIVTPQAAASLWVAQEWQAVLAIHGPRGRIIPVILERAPLDGLLRAAHQIDATHQDAARVAAELAAVAARPEAPANGDRRQLSLDQDLVFSVERHDDELLVTDPTGTTRTITPPWHEGTEFGVARLSFNRLAQALTG